MRQAPFFNPDASAQGRLIQRLNIQQHSGGSFEEVAAATQQLPRALEHVEQDLADGGIDGLRGGFAAGT